MRKTVGEFNQACRLVNDGPQVARLAMKRQPRRISIDVWNPEGTSELQRDGAWLGHANQFSRGCDSIPDPWLAVAASWPAGFESLR